MVDLEDKYRRAIRRIVSQHVPDSQVYLVGSRANGPAKRYSDVDLLIVDRPPLTVAQRAMLTAEFEESDIPYKVDILAWSELTPEFRDSLVRHHAAI